MSMKKIIIRRTEDRVVYNQEGSVGHDEYSLSGLYSKGESLNITGSFSLVSEEEVTDRFDIGEVVYYFDAENTKFSYGAIEKVTLDTYVILDHVDWHEYEVPINYVDSTLEKITARLLRV